MMLSQSCPLARLKSLLNDPEQLKNILLYHVTAGKLMASDVVASDYLTMANSESAKIKTDMGKAYIDTAEIVATDVEAGNGVIHVIDSVILPGKTVVDIARERWALYHPGGSIRGGWFG